MSIEFDSRRKPEDRRKTSCFIEDDRRNPEERRGKALKDLEKERRRIFKRHLNAQR